jgi:hypothetical protein
MFSPIMTAYISPKELEEFDQIFSGLLYCALQQEENFEILLSVIVAVFLFFLFN